MFTASIRNNSGVELVNVSAKCREIVVSTISNYVQSYLEEEPVLKIHISEKEFAVTNSKKANKIRKDNKESSVTKYIIVYTDGDINPGYIDTIEEVISIQSTLVAERSSYYINYVITLEWFDGDINNSKPDILKIGD